MDFLLGQTEEKSFPPVFVVDWMEMVTCVGLALTQHLNLCGNTLNSQVFSPRDKTH